MECALKEDNEEKIVTVAKGNIYSVSIGCAMVKDIRNNVIIRLITN